MRTCIAVFCVLSTSAACFAQGGFSAQAMRGWAGAKTAKGDAKKPAPKSVPIPIATPTKEGDEAITKAISGLDAELKAAKAAADKARIRQAINALQSTLKDAIRPSQADVKEMVFGHTTKEVKALLGTPHVIGSQPGVGYYAYNYRVDGMQSLCLGFDMRTNRCVGIVFMKERFK